METDDHHAHQWCNGAIMGDPVVPNRKKTTTQNCLKKTTKKWVFKVAFKNSLKKDFLYFCFPEFNYTSGIPDSTFNCPAALRKYLNYTEL